MLNSLKCFFFSQINSTVSNNNRRDTVEISNYAKHNGYVNSLNRNNRNQNASIPFDPDDDVFPTKDTNSSKSSEIKSSIEGNIWHVLYILSYP